MQKCVSCYSVVKQIMTTWKSISYRTTILSEHAIFSISSPSNYSKMNNMKTKVETSQKMTPILLLFF